MGASDRPTRALRRHSFTRAPKQELWPNLAGALGLTPQAVAAGPELLAQHQAPLHVQVGAPCLYVASRARGCSAGVGRACQTHGALRAHKRARRR